MEGQGECSRQLPGVMGGLSPAQQQGGEAEGRRQAELCGQSSGSPLLTLARTKTSTSPQPQVSLMSDWLPLQPGASSREGPLEVVSCK